MINAAGEAGVKILCLQEAWCARRQAATGRLPCPAPGACPGPRPAPPLDFPPLPRLPPPPAQDHALRILHAREALVRIRRARRARPHDAAAAGARAPLGHGDREPHPRARRGARRHDLEHRCGHRQQRQRHRQAPQGARQGGGGGFWRHGAAARGVPSGLPRAGCAPHPPPRPPARPSQTRHRTTSRAWATSTSRPITWRATRGTPCSRRPTAASPSTSATAATTRSTGWCAGGGGVGGRGVGEMEGGRAGAPREKRG
jgi:hypothetical protein